MKEIWKDIPGYEGLYKVSDSGIVRSLERRKKHSGGGYAMIKSRILKEADNGHGYHVVQLSKLGKAKQYRIQQLVAMAFINHKPCGHKLVVDHINNIKTDNRIENLQVVTSRYNSSKDRNRILPTGVYKAGDKYYSRIWVNGKDIYLGRYKTISECSTAYLNAIKNYKLK